MDYPRMFYENALANTIDVAQSDKVTRRLNGTDHEDGRK